MEVIQVKTWRRLLGEKCELCTKCRYLEVYEDGELILEDGKKCEKWSLNPSPEDWNRLIDDIQLTRISQMYE